MTTPHATQTRAPHSFDRTLALKITDLKMDEAGNDGTFQGIASAVGVIDRHNEIIAPGAFDATLAEKGQQFPLLWQHNWWEPIGIITLHIDPVSRDLVGKGELNLNTQLGREAHALLKQGAIGAMSIGFNIPPGGRDFDEASEAYVIRSVDLWEVSVVTFPANPAAIVNDVKHAVAGAIAERKAGRVLSAANRAKIEAARDALQEILDSVDAAAEKSACPHCGEEVEEPPVEDGVTPPADDEDDEDEAKAIGHQHSAAELAEVKQLLAQMSADISRRA